MPYTAPTAERFDNLIVKTDSCWPFMGGITSRGYGNFTMGRDESPGRVQINAHRYAYLKAHGKLTENMVIDHLCRNRVCVNPAHLEEVTLVENVMRGESQRAINKRKTECKYGHPFDDKNTYLIPSGGRRCRECTNRTAREITARRNSK